MKSKCIRIIHDGQNDRFRPCNQHTKEITDCPIHLSLKDAVKKRRVKMVFKALGFTGIKCISIFFEGLQLDHKYK